MSDLPDDVVDELLADNRYFAFMDVLGYSGVLFGPQLASERERVHRLYEMWECLYASIDRGCEPFRGSVEPVLFSDSLYMSAIDPIALVGAVAHIYATSCAYYSEHPNSWMPWLRAGLSYGWGIDVNDPTLQAIVPKHVERFRNPAGPGPALAYFLAERAKRKGARALATEFVKTQIFMRCKGIDPSNLPLRSVAEELCSRPWLSDGSADLPTGSAVIFDVPWWRALPGKGAEARRVFERHAWQVAGCGQDDVAHYEQTLKMIDADDSGEVRIRA